MRILFYLQFCAQFHYSVSDPSVSFFWEARSGSESKLNDGSAYNSKFTRLETQNGAMEPRAEDAYNRGMEAQTEAWRIRRPVFRDLHHFDEKQVLDPDPHQS
jgi:hypothetical protein